jgi:hypothetical protein
MQTRKMILQRAGHTVAQARDLREVIASCRSDSFSVVILGPALPRNEKLRVRDVLYIECRDAKVLELHTGVAPELSSADAHLRVTASAPEGLVDCVESLITSRKRRPA